MAVSPYTDFIRKIVAAYAQLATDEGVPGPEVQFSRRYIEQLAGPNRILLVDADGDVGAPLRLSAGYVAAVSFAIDAHIWGIEPDFVEGRGETETELARVEARDELIDRYINVVKAVSPGRSEGVSITLNPEGGRVLVHGELAVVRYTYTRGVEKDRAMDRLVITPSPRDPDRPNGARRRTLTVTTTTEGSR